jgi:hypothetical protein
MIKILKKLDELKVSTNITGLPLTITKNGKTERITRIYRSWQVSDKLSTHASIKNYFKVRTGKGLYDIYHDINSNLWYLG